MCFVIVLIPVSGRKFACLWRSDGFIGIKESADIPPSVGLRVKTTTKMETSDSSEMMRGLLLSAAAPSISREWSFLRCRVEMSLG